MLYDLIELFFVYSPNRFIYGFLLFMLLEIYLLNVFSRKRKLPMLLLAITTLFTYVNFMIPWQSWEYMTMVLP